MGTQKSAPKFDVRVHRIIIKRASQIGICYEWSDHTAFHSIYLTYFHLYLLCSYPRQAKNKNTSQLQPSKNKLSHNLHQTLTNTWIFYMLPMLLVNRQFRWTASVAIQRLAQCASITSSSIRISMVRVFRLRKSLPPKLGIVTHFKILKIDIQHFTSNCTPCNLVSNTAKLAVRCNKNTETKLLTKELLNSSKLWAMLIQKGTWKRYLEGPAREGRLVVGHLTPRTDFWLYSCCLE